MIHIVGSSLKQSIITQMVKKFAAFWGSKSSLQGYKISLLHRISNHSVPPVSVRSVLVFN